MTSLIFIRNLYNCDVVCIYWTVYLFRIHYHSIESYWIVLSKYLKKNVASIPFIFCWRKHILLMINQKKFLIDCHNLLKNNPINTKMSQDLFHLFFWKFGYVMSNGIEDVTWSIFPEIDEKLLMSAQLSHERCSNAYYLKAATSVLSN